MTALCTSDYPPSCADHRNPHGAEAAPWQARAVRPTIWNIRVMVETDDDAVVQQYQVRDRQTCVQ
jgi:hypothetical protein